MIVNEQDIVTEAGTHTQLMSNNGLYLKLNEMQFEFGVVTQSPGVEEMGG